MANEERILTDVGISIPRMSRWERFVVKRSSSIGKRIMNAAFSLTGNKDYVKPVSELFDGVKTLVEIADDYEAGRISGKVVTSTSGKQSNSGFDHYRLIKARQEVKNRKIT